MQPRVRVIDHEHSQESASISRHQYINGIIVAWKAVVPSGLCYWRSTRTRHNQSTSTGKPPRLRVVGRRRTDCRDLAQSTVLIVPTQASWYPAFRAELQC